MVIKVSHQRTPSPDVKRRTAMSSGKTHGPTHTLMAHLGRGHFTFCHPQRLVGRENFLLCRVLCQPYHETPDLKSHPLLRHMQWLQESYPIPLSKSPPRDSSIDRYLGGTPQPPHRQGRHPQNPKNQPWQQNETTWWMAS